MAIFPAQKLSNLQNAMAYSYRKLAPFRNNRLSALKQYVGRRYGENGTEAEVPMNLVELTINVYKQHLANTPSVLATTRPFELRAKANKLTLALNELIRRISFGDTLEMVVMEAFVGMGIAKKGLDGSVQLEIEKQRHRGGMPFWDCVGLDNWVHDMTAKVLGNAQFMGNSYQIPYEDAMDSGIFGKAKDRIVKPGQCTVQETDQSLSGGDGPDRETLYDMIDLWDVWLPKEGVVVTFQSVGQGDDAFSGPALHAYSWKGPEHGMYRTLSFHPVPGNIMPLPPAALWMDMHELANKLFRKLGRQADRQKTVTGVRRAGVADGDRIKKAADGEMIAMDDPNNVKEYKYGGISQETLAFLIHVRDLYSYMRGNLDSLGGLSAQSETLGQDKLLSESASQRIRDMQEKTENFATAEITDLGEILWYDPLIELPLIKRVPGTDITVPVNFGPTDRQDEYFSFDICIEPYSMRKHTPESRLNVIMQVVNNTIIPMMPLLQQQGIGLNVEALLKTISKYARLPELEEILIFADPQIQSDQSVQSMGKSPTTTRNYVRRNVPGATRQGHDQLMQRLLMGGKLQASEAGSLTRSTW